MSQQLEVPLRFRDLEPEDLPDLEWSGGPAHLQVLAQAWEESAIGDVAVLVGEIGNGHLIACGGVRLTRYPDVAELWMLSVAGSWQGLGVGSALIGALEDAASRRGHDQVQLSVELDNPDADRLYRRLGYRPHGTRTESWPVDGGEVFVTTTSVLRKSLTDWLRT